MATGTALRCRECGREYPIAPIYTCEWCFGPLEATYDYEAIAAVDLAGVGSRPARRRSGATARCCRSTPRPVERPRRRMDAADPGRAPGRRARARGALAQGRHPQPHELVQGPGRGGRARQGARLRVQDRGVRLHRQPRQRRGRGRGPHRAGELRVRPVGPRGGQDPHHRRCTAATSSPSTATTTTSTASARSSRPSTRGRS